MRFIPITSPTDGERLYIDVCSTGDSSFNVACILPESNMIDYVMCWIKGVPEDDWKDMLNGLELIEMELQVTFGIEGDVDDLACKIHDRMKETDRKATVKERLAVVGAMV